MQNERIAQELRLSRVSDKIDISFKYAQLAQENLGLANVFVQEISKQNAIGFLYQNDAHHKTKIWIRDNSNMLVGRHDDCDIVISDPFVSRQHIMLNAISKEVFLHPFNRLIHQLSME